MSTQSSAVTGPFPHIERQSHLRTPITGHFAAIVAGSQASFSFLAHPPEGEPTPSLDESSTSLSSTSLDDTNEQAYCPSAFDCFVHSSGILRNPHLYAQA
jgi:hypothetical protein